MDSYGGTKRDRNIAHKKRRKEGKEERKKGEREKGIKLKIYG
jgi:hypothetical protein